MRFRRLGANSWNGASDQACSSWNATRRALERYVAGRLEADGVVAAVTAAYYRETGKGKGETGKGKRETGKGKREALRPVIEVIERAAPGVVELAGSPDGPGFEVRVLGRSFPKQYEADLRSAAAAVLAGEGGREPGPATGTRHAALRHAPGLVRRVVRAILRLFNASA